MINDVFFKSIARLVNVIDVNFGIVGIDLATTFVNSHKHGFDTAGGLGHQTGGTGRRNGEAGNVATTILLHHLIKLRVGLPQTVDKRIILLAINVEKFEGSTLFCHDDRRTIGGQSQSPLHLNGKVGSLRSAITQVHGCQHITLGGNAHTRATSFFALAVNLLPKAVFRKLGLVVLRIAVNLSQDGLNLFLLQIDDVVHDALSHHDMLSELLEVEGSLRGKRIVDIRIQIERQQSATVVRTQRNFTARIGRNRLVAHIGITVGHRLANDGIPEKHTGFCRLPSIVNDFLPKRFGINRLIENRVVATDGELLLIRSFSLNGTHKLIVDFYRHIGSGNFSLFHLGINESLGIGMLDTYRKHQGAASAILSHLTGRIAVTLHKRNQSGRSQRRILHRRTLRTNVGEVVTHASATLHQLHLLFIDFHNGTVRIRVAIKTNHETIREGGNLELISDARHRTSGRNNVTEMIQQLENLICAQGVLILRFNTGNFVGNPPVHISRRLLINVSERIFQGILVNPYASGQLVAVKILQGLLEGLIIGEILSFFHV